MTAVIQHRMNGSARQGGSRIFACPRVQRCAPRLRHTRPANPLASRKLAPGIFRSNPAPHARPVAAQAADERPDCTIVSYETVSGYTVAPNNGTSALGNALGQIPLIGGVLGGVGNLVSGVGNVALGALTGNSSDIEDGVSEFGNGVGGIVGGSLDLAGKAWTFPNTAIGLTAGLVGWALGGEAPVVRNNAIVFVNSPVLPGGLTLGNVILLGTGFGPTGPDSGPNFPEANGPVIDHEEQHTYQGQLLGPLYLPANGIGGLSSMVQAPSGTYVPWHYNNFMENGPQSSPPSPWPP
jgi:hypothetical protein